MHCPRLRTLEAIITGRQEQFRKSTEEWLAGKGITCKQLVMWQGSRPISISEAVEHKARWIHRLGLPWFVESDESQASAIVEKARVPVLCLETRQFYLP